MSLTLGIVGLLTCGAFAALSAGKRGRAPRFGLPAIVGAVAIPFYVDTSPLGRFGLGLFCAQIVLRTIDLWHDASGMTALRRLWHVFTLFDSRRARRVTPQLGVQLFPAAVLATLIAACGLLLAFPVANTMHGAWHFLLRWLGAAIFMVAGVEAAIALIRIIYGWFGIEPPPLHDAPYRSRSVREFWSHRWNKIVGGWLRDNCFRPLVRRGARGTALAITFLVSGLIHWYLFIAALNGSWSLLMASFFFVQPLLMGLEERLGTARWPAPASRAFTLLLLLAASPLFTEPALHLLPTGPTP